MSVVVGESLLYEAARVLRQDHRLSYYQYRALCSFVEMLVLHDKVTVVQGVETDSNFLEAIEWLGSTVAGQPGYSLEVINLSNRGTFVDDKVVKTFEEICKEVYQRPLGIVTDQLLEKHPKDRMSEDMSERIERIYVENYPSQENRRFVDELLRIVSRNATSSELLYFFRAHLLQAIAESSDSTPLFENQRLIAEHLQRTYRRENRSGTLAFAVYRLVNSLFVKVCEVLPYDNSKYPRRSLLLCDLITHLDDRESILPAISRLRDEFGPFREHYKKTETALRDQNTSLFERSEIQAQLNEAINRVWVPTISSLGRKYSAGGIRAFLKNVVGKYGFGDITLGHSEASGGSPGGEVSDSVTYAVPSLVGVGTAIAQTVSSVYQESKLYKPNKPLLECLTRVVKSTDSLAKLETHLPVTDFSYQINQTLDKGVSDHLLEV